MMTSSHAIVFWGKEDLLDSSFESILASREGWEVICVSNRENVEALNRAVEKANPEFVIIRYEKNQTTPFLPIQLIKDHPAIRVITIGFDNNAMEVYSKQTIEIKEVSDLISILDAKF